jgi:hypothetical protein
VKHNLKNGIPDGYIMGLGRDVPHPKLAHLYKGTFDRPGKPMCVRGWNRSRDPLCGEYSIWRGNAGENGVCKICMSRALAGKDGVVP